MPIDLLTISFHQLCVEADFQIDATGPIKESLGFWIERLCFDVVEPVKRRSLNFSKTKNLLALFRKEIHRRYSNSPEKSIVRCFLIRHFLFSSEAQIPSIEDFLPSQHSQKRHFDEGEGQIKASYLFFRNFLNRKPKIRNNKKKKTIN